MDIKLIVLFSISIALSTCKSDTSTKNQKNTDKISWIDIMDLESISSQNSKKSIIFVYDASCETCDSVRTEAFGNVRLNNYLSEKFNLAELNVHDNRKIVLNNKEWDVIHDVSGLKFHSLATAFSPQKDNLIAPLIVFLDEKRNLIVPISKKVDSRELELIAAFIGDDHFMEGIPIETFGADYTYPLTK